MIEDLPDGRAYGRIEQNEGNIAVRGPRNVVLDTLAYFNKRLDAAKPPPPMEGQTDLCEQIAEVEAVTR